MFAAHSSLHGRYQLVCNHSMTTRQETVKLEWVQHKLETENLCIQSKIVPYHCNPYISESTMFTLKADSLCVWFAANSWQVFAHISASSMQTTDVRTFSVQHCTPLCLNSSSHQLGNLLVNTCFSLEANGCQGLNYCSLGHNLSL